MDSLSPHLLSELMRLTVTQPGKPGDTRESISMLNVTIFEPESPRELA